MLEFLISPTNLILDLDFLQKIFANIDKVLHKVKLIKLDLKNWCLNVEVIGNIKLAQLPQKKKI